MKRLGVALALLLLASGCAGTSAFERTAMSRGASVFGCPRESMDSVYLGGGGVDVSGCGQRQSYTCLRAHGGIVCAPDGPPTGTHVAPVASAIDAEDQMQILELLAPCHLAPGTSISVVVGVDGDVLRIDATGPAEACAQAVRGHSFATRADADVVHVEIPAPAPAEPVASAAPAPSATPSELQARVRAMVTARRETILLCNGGAPTAVVADWTADGVLTIRLPDARAGSAEDGCIRESATGARIEPAPGVAGSLLHPVQ